MEPGQMRRYKVRIRYRQPLQDALLICRENGLFVLFDLPQRSITAGQFAVWYALDGEMLICSFFQSIILIVELSEISNT